MTKLIKLDKENAIQVMNAQEEYLAPDFVFVPFPPKKEDLKKELIVKKGEKLYENMYAPVSGKLSKVESCLLPNGKKVNCMVYANDFQEKRAKSFPTRKKINDLTKEEIIKSLFTTSLQKKLNKENISTLLVSGIDDEPYIENEAFIQKTHTKAILDTLEALLNIYPSCKVSIALKNTDSRTIIAYQNLLGSYKDIEIKLVEDLFLIGKEPFLAKYLRIKGNFIYLKANEVYEMYLNIKKRMPVMEKYITLSGNGTEKRMILKVRLGTKVIEIFKKYYKEDLSDCTLYVNGMMQGVQLDVNKLIVTKDLDGILIMKKKNKISKKCIKCGKCIRICPIHSNPLLAYKLGMKVKCIQCGLCTYICPSYIPLYRYLNGDKNE